MDSLATSQRAAQRHVLAVAAGAPRSARWIVPSAAVSAVGAAVAVPLHRPAGLALAAVVVLLLAVHRQDRRNAWRYVPEPVTPARLLAPQPPRQRPGTGTTAPAAPTVKPAVKAVHIPTQPVQLPALPRPRTTVEQSGGGTAQEAAAQPRGRSQG